MMSALSFAVDLRTPMVFVIPQTTDEYLSGITKQLGECAQQELALLKHTIKDMGNGKYRVVSEYPGDRETAFLTVFSRKKSNIQLSCRNPKRAFHANDVTREQYRLAATEGGFMGQRPELIIRRSISNSTTKKHFESI